MRGRCDVVVQRGAGGGPGVGRVGYGYDLQESAVAGCRVQERGTGAGRFRFGGDADAQAAEMGEQAVVVGGFQGEQIGGRAAPAQKAGAGGVGGRVVRRQQLHEGAAAGGQDGIAQAVLGQRTFVAGPHTEDAVVKGDGIGQRGRHH